MRKQLLFFMLSFILLLTFIPSMDTAEAQFNGVGTQNNSTSSGTSVSDGQAVGNIISGVGVDAEASQKAANTLAPLVSVVNTVVALLIGLIILIIVIMSVADIAYITIPALRPLLVGKRQLVSDEALAVAPAQGGQQQGGMGGGGFGGGGFGGGGFGGGGFGGGGFGGGGFGGGGFGGGGMGGQQQEDPSTKNKLIAYMKMKIVTLVVLGICLVLFSTTVFTDIGIKIGTWLLGLLIGVENSIPN